MDTSDRESGGRPDDGTRQQQQQQQQREQQPEQQQQQQQQSGQLANIDVPSQPASLPDQDTEVRDDGGSCPDTRDPSACRVPPDVSSRGGSADSTDAAVPGDGVQLRENERPKFDDVRSSSPILRNNDGDDDVDDDANLRISSTGYPEPIGADIADKGPQIPVVGGEVESVDSKSTFDRSRTEPSESKSISDKSRTESFDSKPTSDSWQTVVSKSVDCRSAPSGVVLDGTRCNDSPDSASRDGRSLFGMTTCVSPPPQPVPTRYVIRRLSCHSGVAKPDIGCADRDTCARRIRSGSTMMLSPTATEIGLIDPDSRTSSRTSTPTMVRTRPRLPTGLTRHRDFAGAGSVNSGTISPPPARTTTPEDIACDFNSLGRIDFVRKYSTRVRGGGGSETLPRVGQQGQGPSAASVLPEYTQNALLLMSGGDVERDRSIRPHTLGGLTPTRTRSIKLKLEKLRDTRRSSEVNILTRKDSAGSSSPDSIRKDSNSSCDADSGKSTRKTSATDSTAAGDAYCRSTENSVPRGQLHRLNITHNQAPLGKERRYFTLPGRRSASPGGEQSADVDARESPSKTVTADRRLLHQNAVDNLSTEGQTEQEQAPRKDSVEERKDVVSDVPSSGKELPLKVNKPTAVHWEIGRDSLDSDRSTPPKDRTKQEDPARKISDTAEDEGVPELDLDPDEAGYRLSSLPRGANQDLWLNLKSPDLSSGSNDQQRAAAPRGVSFKEADRAENVVCGPGKLPNGRFYTHPPSKERTSVQEGGPLDTNGFGALRDTRSSERASSEETQLQLSTVSIDSQSCIGEQDYSTYHDVLKDVTADGTSIDSNLERKNSKTLKQKSKSDPCGEKQKESLRLNQTLDAQVQSTPLLIEEKAKSTAADQSDSSERKTSQSDSSLLKQDKRERIGTSSETNKNQPPKTSFLSNVHRSSSRKRDNRSNKEPKRDAATINAQDSGDSATGDPETVAEIAPILVESDGELLSPDTQSPDSTLGREGTAAPGSQPGSQPGSVMASLTLPFSKAKGTALTRSHSSASVFLSKADSYRNSTPSPGSTRQKDLVKRRPHYSEQHLGHQSTSSGSADLSGHKRDKNWASGYCPSLEPIYAQSSLSLFEGAAEEKDKRDLIVQEFCSTEEQYVEALQMLVERYMIPMKTKSVLDGNLVDDIFYKVNEIYMHHATFLTFLGKALHNWDSQTSTIGDIIHRNFSKQTVIESYVSFIENFPRAEKVLDEISTKSSFQKFVEGCEREMRMRLPLKAHIVKPAQRIPRYELLIKRLLDHTPTDHPDYKCLLEAEKSIHQLALRINSVKESRQEEDYQETLKKLELLLITDLVVADRTYIRHDMVQILSRKDQCCVWLFSDLAVFSSVKRKSGPVNRKTTLLLQSPTGNDFVENSKHKMWLKISLEDLEIVQLEPSPAKKQLVDKDLLESDKKILGEITDLTSQLNCDHTNVDEAINELVLQVNKQLSEHQRKSPPPEANKVELMANTTEGLEHLVMVFQSPEKRASWEAAFTAAKQKLAALAEGKPPEFSQALPITKTRAGMQFSCAAPIDAFNDKHFHDVWVCNSDGYVGHMCLLSLQPEPIVTLNTPVPGCNSRILCICAVPALQNAHKRKNSRRKLGVTAPTILVHEADENRSHNRRRNNRKGRSGYSQSSSSDTDTSNSSDTEDDEPPSRKTSTGSSFREKFTSQSQQSSLQDGKSLDPSKSTMWLGTEDGCILVFTSTDNLKTTKNKIKLQQNAGVLSLCYMEFKVFASLANGDIIVYNNKEDGTWDLSNPVTICVSAGGAPVNKLLAVAGRLWCACQHDMYIVNPLTLEVEVSFTGNPDAKKPIQCMATSGHGVWIACQQSAKVSLFHAMSHQLLTQVNVAQVVAQKLQNADDIIRQHKTACLRITSLLTCKDLLWIGTSAGVILNVQLPKISQATDRNSITLGSVTGLSHGHTGHVRFLTSVDLSPQSRRSLHQDECSLLDSSPLSWRSRRMSLGLHTFNMSTKMLVISGGDGFEDFRNVTPNESTGRDDSTNHLLLWQV